MIKTLEDIRVVFCDIDGVLTDGVKVFDLSGNIIQKNFNDADLLAISIVRKLGLFDLILVSGDNRVNQVFAEKAKLRFVFTKSNNKYPYVKNILKSEYGNLNAKNVAFIGNDLNDFDCLTNFFGVAPSDANDYIKVTCDYITNAAGGKGVLREFVDLYCNSIDKGLTNSENLNKIFPNISLEDMLI